MISLRTEMKKLRLILALACSFTTSTHAVAQAKAAPRAAGTLFRDCRACPEMVVSRLAASRWARQPRKNPGPRVTVPL
jgi:hypothetical protein